MKTIYLIIAIGVIALFATGCITAGSSSNMTPHASGSSCNVNQ